MSTLSGEAPDKTSTEEELERFRLEWQREVRERKAQAPKASELAQIHRAAALAKPDPFFGSKKRTNTGRDVVQESKGKGRASDFDSLKHQHDTPAIVPSIPEPVPQFQAGPSTSPKSQTSVLPGKPTKETKTKKSQKSALAVECYAKAVELEQMGQLNEALNLYRKAYKLEPQVEKSYHHWVLEQESQLLQGVEELQVTDPSKPITAFSNKESESYTFRTTIQTGKDYVPAVSSVIHETDDKSGKSDFSSVGPNAVPEQVVGDRNDPLTKILLTWLDTARDEILHPPPVAEDQTPSAIRSPFTADRLPTTIHDLYHHLPLIPENDKYPIMLIKLPEEVLEHVMDFLDVGSLERFGTICKRLRVMTRGVNKWRTLCEQIYRPPIVPFDTPIKSLALRHGLDYRTTFLEEKRVRYDGVYISVCHYIRPGQSDLAWVNITHLITYHRFLRFYPDGTVISLLTTDQPVDVVHSIRPSLRAKGTLFGRWTLSPREDDSKPDRPVTRNIITIKQMLEPGQSVPKYEFEMDLELKTATRGRWNKLEMRDYSSVNLGTGEVLGLSLKHQKPFYFSKVRSYSNAL